MPYLPLCPDLSAHARFGLLNLTVGAVLNVQFSDYLVEVISLILLPVAVLMCAYALTVFIWRARAISKKQVWTISPM